MDRLTFLFSYLRYLRQRTNEHGIHSPFVFELYNSVFKSLHDYYAFSEIDALRKRLSVDERKISVNDLGAGSSFTNNNERSVKHILRTAVKAPKYSRLLFRLADYFQPKTILELGTSLGISTASLAIAQSKSKVLTIEGSPEILKAARQNFELLKIKNIETFSGNFDDVLPGVLKQLPGLDLVFFDGNHRKLPTLSYFHQCLEKAHNESVFIFDDIYWSKEMTEAWEEIKIHPSVTVTLDIFQMGIVFFRKEQVKQHFVLTY